MKLVLGWLVGAFVASCSAAGVGAPSSIAWRDDVAVEATVSEGLERVDVPDGDDDASDGTSNEAVLARQVVLDAGLRLVVVSADEAREEVLAAAKAAGGYLQQSDARSIVVRVPAARFEEVLANIERLGEVVERNVRAEDVTEELFDIELRIENARRSRERMLAHLEKSERLEDTLKLEAEIARLTEEIERLEGRKRLVASRVAMSTIRVELNAPQRARVSDTERLAVPFEWIGRLGDGLIAGSVQHTPRAPGIFASGPSFDVPPDFAKYHSTKNLVEALEPDGVRITVERHDNHDKASIGFWQRLARRSLVEQRAIAITEEIAIDANRALLVGTRDVGPRRDGYMLLIRRSDSRVFTFEAWGPQERFDELRAALEASARTLRP
jgi:hypothetical protein